jgi:hypothetical protein
MAYRYDYIMQMLRQATDFAEAEKDYVPLRKWIAEMEGNLQEDNLLDENPEGIVELRSDQILWILNNLKDVRLVLGDTNIWKAMRDSVIDTLHNIANQRIQNFVPRNRGQNG